MEQEWITLKCYDNSLDATLAQSVLAQNEIKAMLLDMHMGNHLGTGGVRLLVNEGQLEQAQIVLA